MTSNLLRMSELAERSGVSAATVKHYLREGLLGSSQEIVRTSRNMAYYPPEFVHRIQLIKRLQEERFMPLRVIRDVLAEGSERAERLVELEDPVLQLDQPRGAIGILADDLADHLERHEALLLEPLDQLDPLDEGQRVVGHVARGPHHLAV